MNCRTESKIAKPRQVYYKIKKEIDAAHNFKSKTFSGFQMKVENIKTRDLQIAVPPETTLAQWEQIDRAIAYGVTQNVNVIIVVAQ